MRGSRRELWQGRGLWDLELDPKSSSRAVGDDEAEGVRLVRNHADTPRSGCQVDQDKRPKQDERGMEVSTQPGVWNEAMR